MRIITHSDLHLEFGSGWLLPPAVHGDVMILAGDIVTLRDYEPLDQILRKWKKPVLYVTGNHEYYTQRPMNEEDDRFKARLADRHPHVKSQCHHQRESVYSASDVITLGQSPHLDRQQLIRGCILYRLEESCEIGEIGR
jgi:predicted phosphodiesterase